MFILTDNSFIQLDPPKVIDKSDIEQISNSIYHYHGTCKNMINKKYQVKYKDLDINNLYIGDISVLQSSWGGSTSFPALTTGYIAATYATEDK